MIIKRTLKTFNLTALYYIVKKYLLYSLKMKEELSEIPSLFQMNKSTMYDCMSRCVGKFRVTGISGTLRFRIEELEAPITSVTSLDHFEYQCRPTQRSYNSCQEKSIQNQQKRSQLSAYYYSNCKFLESREEVHNFLSCLISLLVHRHGSVVPTFSIDFIRTNTITLKQARMEKRFQK